VDERSVQNGINWTSRFKIVNENLIEQLLDWLENYHPLKRAWEKWEKEKNPNEESCPYQYFQNNILKPALHRLINDSLKSLFKEIDGTMKGLL
jgi:hypothetical protein